MHGIRKVCTRIKQNKNKRFIGVLVHDVTNININIHSNSTSEASIRMVTQTQ